jgi:glycosyltransferase involved in cell wall biosynthesis
MSKISVIIPVLNAEQYLRRCLDSLTAQTFTDWQAICINDGSTDNSNKILKGYCTSDKRITVINHQKNMGVSAARNEGISVATGQYIHFFDADDFFDADYYEKMFTAASYNNADMVCSGFASNVKYTNGLRYSKQKMLKNLPEKIKKTNALVDSYIWRYLFKKSFIVKNKLSFDKKLISQEDVKFLLQAILVSNWIIIVPKTKYHYVYNQTSALNNKTAKQYNKIKKDYYAGKEFRKDFSKQNKLMLLWRTRKLKKIPMIGNLF